MVSRMPRWCLISSCRCRMDASGQGAQVWGWWRAVTEPTVGSTRGEEPQLLAVAARLANYHNI